MPGGRLVVVPALCAALALVTLSGCSGTRQSGAPDLGTPAPAGAPSATALATVLAAAKSTLAQRAQVSIRLAASPALGVSGHEVTGGGPFDLAASQGRVELGQATGPERVLFVGQSVYVAQSGSVTVLPKGKVWVSAALTEQSQATTFPQFVTQVESLNPSLLLAEIQRGSTAATPLVTVGGDRAYSVVVDLARAQSAETRLSTASAAAYARAIGYQITEQSGGSSPTVTALVVVDHHGRVVALRSAPPGAGVGTVTLGLSGWGAGVSVAEPPPSQVVDISSLSPGAEPSNAAGGDLDGG